MDKPKLLIVEDDESVRIPMKWALMQDYQVLLAEDRQAALEIFKREQPFLVTLDLGLPPNPRGIDEGFRTLGELLEIDPLAKVIIVTGRDEKENAVKAIGEGAYDFFCKPIQVEEISAVLRRAEYVGRLERDHRDLQSRSSEAVFGEILGTSGPMQEVFATIDKVAGTDVPVLILGESGTGKELAARAIHHRSYRSKGPFVAINCTAIPENLLESELFGHEKGAFTGAHAQRRGRIESAEKGTLFLDEIGDMPFALQSKLLRFLQEHSFDRIGGRKPIEVDTRVLAATNSNLERDMLEGRFREDLFYRLGVIVLHLPPLREREGDVLLLSNAFLNKYAGEIKKKVKQFTTQAVCALEAHSWPGNVRELENRVKRAVIMAQGPKIGPEDLQLNSPGDKSQTLKLREARENLEREMILRSMDMNNQNLTKVAAELGISRPTLYELMEKLGIERKQGSPVLPH